MSEHASNSTSEIVDSIYRDESSRVLATLIRLLGDFDLAEEALHDAFAAAVEQWPTEGVPRNPRAWLVSTGRFKAIDTLRRRSRFDLSQAELVEQIEADDSDPGAWDKQVVEDDHLRLIFTCCHPALAPDAQVASTLRTVCGLTIEEIANAFLTAVPTVAQRIVRAKAKIRRRDSLRSAAPNRAARQAGQRIARCLPGVQRGLHRWWNSTAPPRYRYGTARKRVSH